MRERVLILLATVLLLTSGCSSENVKPRSAAVEVATPEGHAPDEAMFRFDGAWEGKLDGYNAPHFIDGVGFPVIFRIVISGDEASVFEFKDGKWVEMKSGLFHIEKGWAQAIVTSITSGHDEDGTWVEGSTFTLVHHNADTVLAYWLRTVNNLDMQPDQEYFQFAWGASGEMHRSKSGG